MPLGDTVIHGRIQKFPNWEPDDTDWIPDEANGIDVSRSDRWLAAWLLGNILARAVLNREPPLARPPSYQSLQPILEQPSLGGTFPSGGPLFSVPWQSALPVPPLSSYTLPTYKPTPFTATGPVNLLSGLTSRNSGMFSSTMSPPYTTPPQAMDVASDVTPLFPPDIPLLEETAWTAPLSGEALAEWEIQMAQARPYWRIAKAFSDSRFGPVQTLGQAMQGLDRSIDWVGWRSRLQAQEHKQHQTVLDRLFQQPMFQGPEFDPERNMKRLVAIADWILTGRRTQRRVDAWDRDDWAEAAGRIGYLTAEEKRLFKIAGKLHQILAKNEALGNQRNDARAFAESLAVLVEANQGGWGGVNEDQFKKDLVFFAIDHRGETPWQQVKQLATGFYASNAAYNLLGGPRLGAIGWSPKYWDHGELYEHDQNGKLILREGQPVLINQAHHFAAFFIRGLEVRNDLDLKRSQTEVKILDKILDKNLPDVKLGITAIAIILGIRNSVITWDSLPSIAYRVLTR